MSATRVYARVLVLTAAGALSLEYTARLLGLPMAPAYLAGGVLGIAAACVRWRGVGLRLLAAWLRAFPGRDLAYFAVDYSGRDEAPEALVVLEHGVAEWGERLCCLCEEHRMDAMSAAEIGRLKLVRDDLRELAEEVRTERAAACDAEAAAQFTSRVIAELERDMRSRDLRRSIILPEPPPFAPNVALIGYSGGASDRKPAMAAPHLLRHAPSRYCSRCDSRNSVCSGGG